VEVCNQTDERSLVKPVPKTGGVVSLVERDTIVFLASENGWKSITLDVAFSGSEIVLHITQLVLLVIGNLAFFADALGNISTC
jgi:hypothetical protein